MARRTPTTSRTSARTSATADAAPSAEGQGSSIESHLAIVTAVLLLAAIIMLDYFHGTRYGGGVFFK